MTSLVDAIRQQADIAGDGLHAGEQHFHGRRSWQPQTLNLIWTTLFGLCPRCTFIARPVWVSLLACVVRGGMIKVTYHADVSLLASNCDRSERYLNTDYRRH